jgi:hypothetical protein
VISASLAAPCARPRMGLLMSWAARCSTSARVCAAHASRIICIASAPGRNVQADEDRAHELPRRPARALHRVVRAGARRGEGCAQTIRAREAVARERARARTPPALWRQDPCARRRYPRTPCVRSRTKPLHHVCKVASAGRATEAQRGRCVHLGGARPSGYVSPGHAQTTSAGVRLRGASTSGGCRGARALTRRTQRRPLSDAARLAPASRRYGSAAAASPGARLVPRRACASQPRPCAQRQRSRRVELVAPAEREPQAAERGPRQRHRERAAERAQCADEDGGAGGETRAATSARSSGGTRTERLVGRHRPEPHGRRRGRGEEDRAGPPLHLAGTERTRRRASGRIAVRIGGARLRVRHEHGVRDCEQGARGCAPPGSNLARE